MNSVTIVLGQRLLAITAHEDHRNAGMSLGQRLHCRRTPQYRHRQIEHHDVDLRFPQVDHRERLPSIFGLDDVIALLGEHA